MNALKVIFLFVAVLVIGQVTDWGVADHLAIALLVLLVAAWIWTRLSLRGVSVLRMAGADRAQVGQSLRETLAVRNRHEISLLIEEIVRGWDAEDMAEKAELEIGRDLQYIRINGMVVGGIVGVALYAMSKLL